MKTFPNKSVWKVGFNKHNRMGWVCLFLSLVKQKGGLCRWGLLNEELISIGSDIDNKDI